MGAYDNWIFIDGQPVNSNEQDSKNRLILKSDGTYEHESNAAGMVVYSIKAQGKFTVSKNKLVLTGTSVTRIDRGQGEQTRSGPHEMTMNVVDGMLEPEEQTIIASVWRKEGSGPPPFRKNPQLSESEPAALALINQIENTYDSMDSLTATGTVSSYGGGFVAVDAKFTILFERPSRFRFEAYSYNKKSIMDRSEVTWDGSETCWWYDLESGEVPGRTLGNVLGIVSVKYGPAADLLPGLLLPNEQLGRKIAEEFPEATLLPDEKINGKSCSVLNLRTNNADSTKFWVDKETGLIVRIFEELREVTVEIDSQSNAKIKPSELMLGKRSKPTAL